jgi:hypothetical protein
LVLRISWVNYLEIGGLISITEGSTSFLSEVSTPLGGNIFSTGDFGIFSCFATESGNTVILKFFCTQIADIVGIFDRALAIAVGNYCDQQLASDTIVACDLYSSRFRVRTARRVFSSMGGGWERYTHSYFG